MSGKTTLLKEEGIKRDWWFFDLEGKTLGRVATQIANILRGKHKPTYTPSMDGGDYVVAVNATKLKLTGNKWEDKNYFDHSLFPGGLRKMTAEELRDRHPEQLLVKAVKGMLPKNTLSHRLITKLKVYGGAEHPHVAQNPKTWTK